MARWVSEGSAAGGGRSDLSAVQRSARDEGAPSPRTFAGHRKPGCRTDIEKPTGQMQIEASSRNHIVALKKISVRKTPKPQRFRGFVIPFFKVKFKRYHFPKMTFGEGLKKILQLECGFDIIKI